MTKYAIYYQVRYQDGREDGWQLFDTLTEVETYLTDSANENRHDEGNTTYKVFEVTLGKELIIKQKMTEIPQPSLKKYKVTLE